MSDLIHKIVGTIIEVGQSDVEKFKLGETIRYSPSEILEILKQHENEIFGEESSTQTNTSNTLNALDTIYRQAAIDAMEESKRIYVDRRVIIGKMQDIVNNLPSAQPEKCEDCGNFNKTRLVIPQPERKQRKRKGRDALGRLIVDGWHLEVRGAEITKGEIPHIIRVGIDGFDHKGAWFTCWLEGEKNE